ncbi:hypothetical protein ABZZ01_34790, partial [Streptomyces virginiae]|uniref:hypothetical protein n=1 Tax=Streptomyces virginiae TaxID=1961 RepID=UPI0033B6CF95
MDEGKATAATTHASHPSPARPVMTESPRCTFAAIPDKSESATLEVDAPDAADGQAGTAQQPGPKVVFG